MNASRALSVGLALTALSLPACHPHAAHGHGEQQKIITTSPMVQDVVVTQPYVCQIRAQQFIEVKALVEGYLDPIGFEEGQMVKEGDVLFQIFPPYYQAKLEAEQAEVKYAELELKFTKDLAGGDRPVVAQSQVALDTAKLARAVARAAEAKAERQFTVIRAKFDGIVDRQKVQLGGLVKKDDVLTNLSDTSVMRVYYNVPEARYLEDKAMQERKEEEPKLELMLANGSKFKYNVIKRVVEGMFDNTTGNIQYRADFPNPDRLLRHGQTGTILVHRKVKDALVIPQRATFEILDKRYVFVVDKDDVAHQREIAVEHELEDVFVVRKGLEPGDRIVLEGVRQVSNEMHVESEFQKPEEALAHLKFRAE